MKKRSMSALIRCSKIQRDWWARYDREASLRAKSHRFLDDEGKPTLSTSDVAEDIWLRVPEIQEWKSSSLAVALSQWLAKDGMTPWGQTYRGVPEEAQPAPTTYTTFVGPVEVGGRMVRVRVRSTDPEADVKLLVEQELEL